MKNSVVEQYLSARNALLQEKSALETRLAAITATLNGETPSRLAISDMPVAEEAPAPRPGRRKRRRMSPEARARIAEGSRKRWAAFRREKKNTK